jgi:hypothetical protein
MNVWTWESEQDQIFLEYFVDTWHIILHKVEEYYATCLRIKNEIGWKNVWKIKPNEKKDKQTSFTTKNYVSIQTLTLHNCEICVNWNTTCSFPRGMIPLRIGTI